MGAAHVNRALTMALACWLGQTSRKGPLMKWAVSLLCLCLMAACDASPAPKMIGATRFETVVEGRSFVVYQKGTLAEVVRLGWAGVEERQGMRERMIQAAAQATGCKPNPASAEGDDGELKLRISCPKG